MACTTILVGKAASYDGSTMIARNDDSGSGHFTAKKFTVIHPEDLPKTYRSVLSPCGSAPAGGRHALYRHARTPWRVRASGRLPASMPPTWA